MKMTRIQRSRAKGARLPENTLCVGRPSIWGNPWVGPDAVQAYKVFCEQVVTGVLCIQVIESKFRVKRVFVKPIEDWWLLRKQIFSMKNNMNLKHVACWCGIDKACHGDVIIALPYLIAWEYSLFALPRVK